MSTKIAIRETAVNDLLLSIGELTTRDGLKGTPYRVAKMYEDLFYGYHEDPAFHLGTTFEVPEHQELVLVKDIPFYSMCEHHMLPFFGKAAIGYIPEQRVVGLSKLVRMLDVYSRRLQVQERLTTEVADTVYRVLDARGVIVVIEAEHLCMSMRGIQRPGTTTVTSAVRGVFHTNTEVRAEALQLIR